MARNYSKGTAVKDFRTEYAPYVDEVGNISEGSWRSGNPHLFNGQVVLLETLAGEMSGISEHALEYVRRCKIVPGLYGRYPERDADRPHDAVSHDEYNGLMFLSLYNQKLALDIYRYGAVHCWQYSETAGANFFRLLKSSPVKAVKGVFAFFKDLKSNPQDDSSVDTRHDSDIVALRYWRQPRDVCFYKVMAGKNPSFFEELYLAAATINSAFSGFEYARGGSMLMAWCRYKCLELSGNNYGVLRLGNFIFRKILKWKYGKNYVKLIFKTYFPEDHPTNKLLTKIDESELR